MWWPSYKIQPRQKECKSVSTFNFKKTFFLASYFYLWCDSVCKSTFSLLNHPKMFSKCSKNNKNYTSIYQIIPLFRQKRSKWRGKKTPTEKCIIYKTSKTIWISNVNRWSLFYSFEFGMVLGSFAMIIVIVECLYRFVLYLTVMIMIYKGER